jgi:hypothetical protein
VLPHVCKGERTSFGLPGFALIGPLHGDPRDPRGEGITITDVPSEKSRIVRARALYLAKPRQVARAQTIQTGVSRGWVVFRDAPATDGSADLA